MTCLACGRPTDPQHKWCGYCGASLTERSGCTVSTGGGDVRGGIYLAGRDMIVSPAPSVIPSAQHKYEAVPKWRSPFTQGLLSWIGLFVGLAGVFPIWKLVESCLDLLTKGPRVPLQGFTQIWWVFPFFLPLGIVFAIVILLHRVAKYQLRKPLFLGWALSGVGRRITLEKIYAGDCPQCGGKMRYYNKPTRWNEYIDARSGKKRREVTERVPAFECKRNPKHWIEVDPAEVEES